MILLLAAFAASGTPAPVGPGSGLDKTTTCYLAESRRLSRSSLAEREIASRVIELCKEEIDLASAEIFPGYEIGRQKLIVSVKDQVVEEVRSLRSSRNRNKGRGK